MKKKVNFKKPLNLNEFASESKKISRKYQIVTNGTADRPNASVKIENSPTLCASSYGNHEIAEWSDQDTYVADDEGQWSIFIPGTCDWYV